MVINRNASNRIGPETHHPSGLHERHMSVFADQHDRIRSLIETPAMPGAHQCCEIAEGSTAGKNTTSPLGQIKPGGKPAAQLTLQLTQTRRKLFSQQIVVEARTDQFSGN